MSNRINTEFPCDYHSGTGWEAGCGECTKPIEGGDDSDRLRKWLSGRISALQQHHGFSRHTTLMDLKHRRGESRERFLLRVADYGVVKELQDILWLLNEKEL